MNKEIRQLISTLEIASDEIVKDLTVTEDSVEALRLIKNSVSKIQTTAYSWSPKEEAEYAPVLSCILDYVRRATSYPEAIEFFAQRIQSHVDEYLRLRRPYDAEYERRKDLEMDTFVTLRHTTRRMDQIAKEMRMLVDQKIQGNVSQDSPRYQDIVTRYNDLQQTYNSEAYHLERLQQTAKENGLIRREIQKQLTLEEMSTLRTMTLEEFSALAYGNKEKELEEQAMFSAFEQIAAEVTSTPRMSTGMDLDFQRAVEETLLEQMLRNQAQSFEAQVAELPKDELLQAMLQLNQKIHRMEEELQSVQGQQQKNTREILDALTELNTKTQDAAALREDAIDDIVKEVEYCLSRKPMDIQSAYLKVRSCIELYCRYVYGVDLNDELFFEPGEKRWVKFQAVGLPQDLQKNLKEIYEQTSKFVHAGVDTIGKDEEAQANQLRAYARNLKSWKIDQYTLEAGIPLYYRKQDEMLVSRMRAGMFDRDFFERDRNSKKSRMKHYFERMNVLGQVMEAQKYPRPEITISTETELYAYLDQLEKEKTEAVAPQTAAPAPAASAPAAAAVPAPKVVASAPDNAKKEGVIKWYNGQRGFGIIEPNLYFHITEVDDQRLCVDGARVSYRLGKNDKGPCAKSIHIISTPEQA